MPLAEIVDRYTILKLKIRSLNDLTPDRIAKEKSQLEDEFAVYSKAIDKYRDEGVPVSDEIIQRLYDINAKCWDMENDMRRNMSRVSELNGEELEEIGRSAVMMLVFNKDRTAIKNEIKDKYKKNVETIKMPLSEIIDRYAILKLKSERINSLTPEQILYEKPSLERDVALYAEAIDNYRKEGVKVEDGWITKLYEINAKCWDIESDIRQGKEDLLGLKEVGRISMMLREVHKGRIGLKNEIVEKSKSGFKEVKIIK